MHVNFDQILDGQKNKYKEHLGDSQENLNMDRRGMVLSKKEKKEKRRREKKAEEGNINAINSGRWPISKCSHQLCPSRGQGHQVEHQPLMVSALGSPQCLFLLHRETAYCLCVLIQCVFELQVCFSCKILCVKFFSCRIQTFCLVLWSVSALILKISLMFTSCLMTLSFILK